MRCVGLRASQINDTLTVLRNAEDVDIARLLLLRVRVLEDTGCWILNNDWSEYTSFQKIPAHRLSFRLFKGNLYSDIFICHHCDRKGCINPEHLFAGTASSNVSDFRKKKKTQRIVTAARVDRLRPNDKAVIKPWWHDHKEIKERTESVTRRMR